MQIYNNFASATKAGRSRNPFTPGKIAVVRNGVDLGMFENIPLENGRVRILGIGSLLPIKRWDRLVTAAGILKEKGLDFVVQIAGSGPLRDSLEQQAGILGLHDRIQLVGYSDNVQTLLSASTVLAHTSDVEGCPNAVMEAMASGRAVVAMDAGDIPSIVDDGNTGFVVGRGDNLQLIERLQTLISNRDLCRQMGQAGRRKAERQFGLHRFVEETLAAYRAAGWRDL
jgi:glycosyltransferase involved in cell wall biosynthesis